MPESPRVSVCVSAFNAQRYIAETLESLVNQSFPNIEIIVVDDGSTDGTADIASTYARRDNRIKIFRNGVNRGLVFSRNRALGEARGTLIATADADDISEPDRLSVQVGYLDENPQIGLVGSDVTLIDEEGSRIGEGVQRHHTPDEIRFFLIFGPVVHNPTTVYRRELLERVGGYSPGFDAGAEDYHVWGKLSAVTSIANLARPLVRYRKHAASVTAERSGVDANIFRISAGLVGDYVGKPVSADNARLLHQWMNKHGMAPHDCRIAYETARAVWERAIAKESKGIVTQLRDLFSDASWTHAQYLVYTDRRLSLELAGFSARLGPVSRGHYRVLAYAGRLATPRALRSLVRSLSRGR